MSQPELEPPDEPPPILGTWTRVYTLVLLNLVVVIAALWAWSRFLG